MFSKSNSINLFIMRRVFRRRLWQADALAEVLPNEEVYFAELVGGGVALAEDCLVVNRSCEDLLRHVMVVFRDTEAVTGEMHPL
ncbi:hypothetical protein quinque_014958 [Culex quinquefasciatus]